MTPKQDSLKPGDELSGYLITQKNETQDGPGTTYRCKHPFSQSQFQARVFPEQNAQDDSFVAILKNEVLEMTRLKYPFLLRLRTAGLQDGLPYLISEDCDAPTLAAHIATETPLAGEHAHRLLLQLIEVIEYLHKHNTAHGLIKPAYIRLNEDGQLRLDGLGLAALTSPKAATPEQDIREFGKLIETLLPLLRPTAQWSLPTAPLEKWQAFANKCQQTGKHAPYDDLFQLQADLHHLGPRPSPITLKAALLVVALFATLATAFFLALGS